MSKCEETGTHKPLVALSQGGMVAQEVAISYPERVMKLVLGSTFVGGEINRYPSWMMKALGIQEGSTNVDIRSIDMTKMITAVVSLAFNKRLYRMILVPLSKCAMNSINVGGHFGQMSAVDGYTTVDRLHLIKAPTLVITGTWDRLVSPHYSETIASRIPNAKLVMVEGLPRLLHGNEDRFNREVLDFLRGN